jgi:DNA-binding transcriptional LysR family regulator
MSSDFAVPSDDCKVLLLLDTTGSIKATAAALRRDTSVVTRQITRIAETYGLAEKVGGKWQVSEAGHRLNAWTQDAILNQRTALSSKISIRIATTREFASRILIPALPTLFSENQTLPTILVGENHVERMLLQGEADIGLDCGRPRDPVIRFRRLLPEEFVIAMASSKIEKRVRAPKAIAALLELPYLQYQRLSGARLLGLSTEIPRVRAIFNDLATTRAACQEGLGWSIFPRYVVEAELKDKTLTEITLPGVRLEPEQFGVWWLRDRPALENWAEKFAKWLKTRKL